MRITKIEKEAIRKFIEIEARDGIVSTSKLMLELHWRITAFGDVIAKLCDKNVFKTNHNAEKGHFITCVCEDLKALA